MIICFDVKLLDVIITNKNNQTFLVANNILKICKFLIVFLSFFSCCSFVEITFTAFLRSNIWWGNECSHKSWPPYNLTPGVPCTINVLKESIVKSWTICQLEGYECQALTRYQSLYLKTDEIIGNYLTYLKRNKVGVSLQLVCK